MIRVIPIGRKANLTIVAYGGMADLTNQLLEDIFRETDNIPELIVPSLISALPVDLVARSVESSGKLVVLEEGSPSGGIGSELIAGVMERSSLPVKVRRIGALPVPIPSVKSLEHIVLPDRERIIAEIIESFK